MLSKLYYSSFVCNASHHMQVSGTQVIIHFWKMLSTVPSISSCNKYTLINHTQPLLPPEQKLWVECATVAEQWP